MTMHDETYDEPPFEELSSEECWELLDVEQLGRLAYRLVDEVHLVPVNYTVLGDRLLFRTAAGNKLLAAALESDVAFEIDWHDDHVAWSVVVGGRLRMLPEDEADRANGHLPEPWVPDLKYDVVELTPDRVSGRRFRLRPAHAGSPPTAQA